MTGLEHERTGSEFGITRRPAGTPLSNVRPWMPIHPVRTAWTYRRVAALHPYNLVALAIALLLGLVNLSGTVLLLGVGTELLFLAVAPAFPFVRRWLDTGLDEEDEARARRARDLMIAAMGELHRRELARLEGLLDRIRESPRGAAFGFRPEDRLGLGRLPASYIRLAITHRACEQALATTSPGALKDMIRSLEAAEHGTSDRMRAVIRRRLSIAYRRVECWQRTRESVEVSGHQLAAIADLIHLAYQEALAPVDARGLCDDLDRLLGELEGAEGAARELVELGIDEPDDDNFVLPA